MPGPVFLRADRVTLRPVEDEDVEFLARNHNDPRVRRWMPRTRPMDRDGIRAEYVEGGGDDSVSLLVCRDDGEGQSRGPDDGEDQPRDPGDPERLGFCALFRVRADSGRAEVGVWLAPDAWGQGYATESLERLVEYAFTERRFHRLNAGALATNDRSQAMLDRVGFREEGRRRDYYFVDGAYVDRVVYGLLESEWRDGE